MADYIIIGLEPSRDGKYKRYVFYTASKCRAKKFVKQFLDNGDIGVRYCLTEDRVKHEEELDLIQLLLK